MYAPSEWHWVRTLALPVVISTTPSPYIAVGGPSGPWQSPPPGWACGASHALGWRLPNSLAQTDATATEYAPGLFEWSFTDPLPPVLDTNFTTSKGNNIVNKPYGAETVWWGQPALVSFLEPLRRDWWRTVEGRVIVDGGPTVRVAFIGLVLGQSRTSMGGQCNG